MGIGALHATRTKADAPPPLGHAGFAGLARLSDLPAVAIGGITPADLPRLRDAGAVGAAAVSGICAAADPCASARAYARAWDRAPGGEVRMTQPTRVRTIVGSDSGQGA